MCSSVSTNGVGRLGGGLATLAKAFGLGLGELLKGV
jgi:hypothetical protein